GTMKVDVHAIACGIVVELLIGSVHVSPWNSYRLPRPLGVQICLPLVVNVIPGIPETTAIGRAQVQSHNCTGYCLQGIDLKLQAVTSRIDERLLGYNLG